ncbi:5-formyltetrahydrofolate cyclo-ligase [Geothermobacter hydrogeniphilus]|uniref:5-formyltetrahydrofolate cyclo-ligase n=1 Tax=Geothermobacter hydrogeniphilus TaxID=1969733 RepID=A0A1X0XW61_9BACT|nr:5-formyltetrahydrofolate cyclo-ligase [Geothermobacter hydrogeniphilus]ORJ57124.1 5-formyltetrahydrofolate cyclo-ligase [Geothermobacter hydrogeniphilus]
MKKQLRKNVLRERMELNSHEVAARSRAVCERLLQMPEFCRAETVKFFISFRNEVATGDVIRQALDFGKRVVVPVTDVVGRKMVPSRIERYPQDLHPGAFGILEPAAEKVCPVSPREIDFVAVPGVAFDLAGNRLGYGGGFYDRFLPGLKPEATLVGLAFELQIKEHVYPELHDCPVDWIITEKRLIRCLAD